ncbi:hypothetical protein RIVM261_038570 [Rivularia sp. IAM M-261]|nr:hypothetical protein CAL7716_077610 [Calothrix sp. PCC 7716]GJD18901.1 hypothetical protein RIVM261_038570 [Rivularia sp. IAM M-261]
MKLPPPAQPRFLQCGLGLFGGGSNVKTLRSHPNKATLHSEECAFVFIVLLITIVNTIKPITLVFIIQSPDDILRGKLLGTIIRSMSSTNTSFSVNITDVFIPLIKQ